jgi:hypothetical protein
MSNSNGDSCSEHSTALKEENKSGEAYPAPAASPTDEHSSERRQGPTAVARSNVAHSRRTCRCCGGLKRSTASITRMRCWNIRSQASEPAVDATYRTSALVSRAKSGLLSDDPLAAVIFGSPNSS